MNWFVYLPPVVSIILVVSSGGANRYLEHLSKSYYPQDKLLQNARPVFVDIALDWAARVGIFNSMFTSFFSCASVYSGPQTSQFILGTLAVLLVIFILLFYWILSYETGQFATERKYHFWKWHMTGAELCNIIWIAVNIILIIEIFIVQILSVPSPPNHK
jgi:hypothetical protein